MESEYIKSLKKILSAVENSKRIDPILEKEIQAFLIDEFRFPDIGFVRKIPSFERVTINKSLPGNKNERVEKVKYLLNPPKQFVNNYGRANLKNQSVFYATFSTPIAIKELRPDVGDILTLSVWTLLNSYKHLNVFPIFKPEEVGMYKKMKDSGLLEKTRSSELSLMLENFLKGQPQDEKKLNKEVLKFSAECFAKKIDAKNNSQYIFTAALTNNLFYNFFGGKIEAITYPTVQDPTKIENIAIKPMVLREKYALSEVREYRLLGYNGDQIALDPLGITHTFIGGSIIWN